MKTYRLIFALSFISFISSGQAKVSGTGKLAGSGGGAAAASYAATGKVVLLSDTPKTSIGTATQQQVTLSGAALPGGAVVSSTRQTQGTTFGEKVNQGLHAAGSAVASGASKTDNPLYQGNTGAQDNPLHKSEAKITSPGNPIGGIIVKGGKNK